MSDLLLLQCLSLGVFAAPYMGLLSSNYLFLQDNLEFSRKITSETEELTNIMCDLHNLCKEDELQIIQKQLGLQSTPLDQCQNVNFNRDRCFTQLYKGLSDFTTLIKSKHLPQEQLEILSRDIKDLLTNVQEEMEIQGITVVNNPVVEIISSLSNPFHEQAATFLILSDLHKFMLMVQNAFGSR
ncbi:granulocyte colony-stimulating factor [Pelodytes ibericus]